MVQACPPEDQRLATGLGFWGGEVTVLINFYNEVKSNKVKNGMLFNNTRQYSI